MHNDFLKLQKNLKLIILCCNYCRSIATKYDIKIGGVNKLVPNLGNKSEYVLHCKNLQLYLSLGMKLVIVHRVLEFKQSDWLKKYIDFNIGKKNSNSLVIVLKNFFLKTDEQE